jgi:hypothetical protein
MEFPLFNIRVGIGIFPLFKPLREIVPEENAPIGRCDFEVIKAGALTGGLAEADTPGAEALILSGVDQRSIQIGPDGFARDLDFQVVLCVLFRGLVEGIASEDGEKRSPYIGIVSGLGREIGKLSRGNDRYARLIELIMKTL